MEESQRRSCPKCKLVLEYLAPTPENPTEAWICPRCTTLYERSESGDLIRADEKYARMARARDTKTALYALLMITIGSILGMFLMPLGVFYLDGFTWVMGLVIAFTMVWVSFEDCARANSMRVYLGLLIGILIGVIVALLSGTIFFVVLSTIYSLVMGVVLPWSIFAIPIAWPNLVLSGPVAIILWVLSVIGSFLCGFLSCIAVVAVVGNEQSCNE